MKPTWSSKRQRINEELSFFVDRSLFPLVDIYCEVGAY